PDSLQQLGAALYPAASLGERYQELVLGSGEVHLTALERHAMSRAVHVDGAGAEYGPGRYRGPRQPPQHRTDTQDQLLRRERLHHVVISAQGQALDPVAFLFPCGQKDHAYVPGFGPTAELLQDFVTRDSREHEIEDHEVGRRIRRGLQRLRPATSG